GFCRSLHPVADLVRRHGIPLIVDAAAALGGRACDGSWVGMSGDVEVFSMHATKTFNIGEGGMLLTSPDIADTARSAINFHLRRPDIASPAMNAKVDEFRAAVALAVLERIEGFVERRRAIAERYSAFFRLCPGVAVPANVGLPPWQCYPIQLPRGVDVAQLVRRLAEAGLEARPYYRPALHRTCLFGRFARGPLPVTEEAEDRTLCLPVYSDMTEEELAQILAILKSRLVPLIEVQTARLAAG
ncbi:MAG: DegT/DnrJ/EryC1/StrS family aminotransferase, partial [Chloroflexi bacterium]|nr:DegT/DnrJ/EryC1/StrS family aminotransferase [Chloroflexota bacterium]